MKKIIVTLIGITILALGGGFYSYRLALRPVNPDAPAEVLITIEKGASAKTVADKLFNQGLIRNRFVFSEYLKLKGFDRRITAGRFRLSPSLSTPQIIAKITSSSGQSQQVAITIPPGSTLKQINETIVSLGLATAEELATFAKDKKLEGFLFPDTYFADAVSFKPETFFAQLLENFNTKTGPLQEEAKSANKDWNTVVTLASILEREIKTPDDFPVVAGILWKRLEAGWALGADATLLYNDDDGTLSIEDLRRDSPYNTRIRPGLPPTPISNPGLKTLEAGLHPKESPYWFYLTETTDGKVIYAKTRQEHERNVSYYLH